jgi:[ribosomal protein S5]-alanine N-acetyltransferase
LQAEEGRRAGTLSRFVVLDEDGAVAGSISLENIVRGAAQSATLGYWVDEQRNGRGLATRAVAAALAEAFGALDLHRVQAPVKVDNVASQRVLAKNAFERIGAGARIPARRRPVARPRPVSALTRLLRSP